MKRGLKHDITEEMDARGGEVQMDGEPPAKRYKREEEAQTPASSTSDPMRMPASSSPAGPSRIATGGIKCATDDDDWNALAAKIDAEHGLRTASKGTR
jgi:hypothetical protein